MKKLLIIALVLLVTACTQKPSQKTVKQPAGSATVVTGLNQQTSINNTDYDVLNQNKPGFTKADIEKGRQPFEEYAPLDRLGRCGVAYARIGLDSMPTGRREPIGMIRPSGWQYSKYYWIDGKYLYNRCHLIGHQLAGENANPLNLITCTRHMNAIGMLPFENQVAEYVRKTGNHVLYRVTPVFRNQDLVARGVKMEAWSLEDNGSLHFHVFVHNIQPNVSIDYADGSNHVIEN